MDVSKNIHEKLLELLNKLKFLQAVRSFTLKIDFEDINADMRVTLIEIDETLGNCLEKLTSTPRQAEIRNVITKLVNKKNINEPPSDAEGSCKSGDEELYYCDVCGADFKIKSKLESHLRIHDLVGDFLFSCNYCNQDFNSKRTLKAHKMSHKKYLCEYCGKRFTQTSTWSSHLFEVHKVDKNLKCGMCPRSYLTFKKLRIHLKTHTKPYLKCSICLKKFLTKKLFRMHKLTHEEKSFSCELCPRKFVTISRLNYHVKEIHEIIEGDLDCDVCGVTFKSKSGLRNHTKEKHTELICWKEGCVWNGIKFSSKSDYENHVLSDCKFTPQINFSCTVPRCKSTFKHARSLKKHIGLKHSTKKQEFTCNLCNMSFSENGKLNRHLLIHVEEKFQCGSCQKCFARADGLKRHVSTVHENDKNFPCSLCSQTFSLKFNRDVHEETVHGGENLSIQCEVCGRKCKNKVTFKVHFKTHLAKNLLCNLCGKTFIRKIHYKTHMKKKHSNFSPFQNLFDSVLTDNF